MMKATAERTREHADPTLIFRDGLGDRYLASDPQTGDPVERFVVGPDLASQERALRERVERLANFRHVRFPRLRAVEAETVQQSKSVCLVADHVAGHRLSQIVAAVATHPSLVVDVNAALQVVREVLPALAVLHDSRGVTHGALGLERLVLTPQARVLILDHGLGLALSKLQFPRTRLWRDFRIAMPPSAGIPRFDARTDVANVALGLLTLMLGRPLPATAFPNGLADLLGELMEKLPNGTARPVSAALRGWLERALPIESRRAFTTANEANLALEDVLKRERAYTPSQSALRSFLQRYAASVPAEDTPGQSPRPDSPVVDAAPAARATPARAGSAASAAPARRPAGRGMPARLTPEEEEAEEIRALEAELARIARLEAEAAAAATPASQPASDGSASLTTTPEMAAAAEPVAPPSTDAPAPAPAPESADPPEVAPALAFEDATGPTDRAAAPDPVVEVEIVSVGQSLPYLDVATLDANSTSAVVSSEPLAIAPGVAPQDRGAADEEEIRSLERLIEELKAGDQAASCAAQVVAVEDEASAWRLTPPSTDAFQMADGEPEPAPVRDDWTQCFDFETEPTPAYLVRLIESGCVSDALVAEPGLVSPGDLARLQLFTATAPPRPEEAAHPARLARRRQETQRRRRQRALPAQATQVAAELSTRPASVLESVVQPKSGNTPVPLRLVAGSATRARRRRPEAIPETATPAASSVERPELHLVRPAPDSVEPIVADLEVAAGRPSDDVTLLLDAVAPPVDVPVLDWEPASDTLAAARFVEAIVPADALGPADVTLPEPVPADQAELTSQLEAALADLIDPAAAEVAAPSAASVVFEVPDLGSAAASAVAEDDRPGVAESAGGDSAPTATAAREIVTANPSPVDEAPCPEDSVLAAAERERRTRPAARKRGRRRTARPASPAPSESPAAPPAPVLPAPLVVVDPPPTAAPPDESPAPAIAARSTTPETQAVAPPASEPMVPYAPWRVPKLAEGALGTRPTPPRPPDPWSVEAEAAKTGQVVPFQTPAPAEHHPAPLSGQAVPQLSVTDVAPPSSTHLAIAEVPGDAAGRVVAFERRPQTADAPPAVDVPVTGRRRWRINWKRTAAASLAVLVLEGVAFATAYWLVRPAEIGRLLVETSQPGVEVLIDGRRSGTTPLSVQLKPGRYTLEMRGFGQTRVVPVEISPGVQTTQAVKWTPTTRVGSMKVTTTPDGARILLDGKPAGVAPLVIDDVPAGQHTIVAESPSGTVKSVVTVTANEREDVDLGIFSGWLNVFAPIEVRIFDGGKLLGTSLDGKLLLPPGTHQVELVNTRLGYRETRTVEIEPGKLTALSVTAPNGTIVIEAPDGTNVVIDGQAAGTMPIAELTVPIGTREVVLSHPAIGQRRVPVTVGVGAPARVSLLAPQ